MLAIEERTATVANNLANVDTAAFKSDLLLITSAPSLRTWRVDDPATRDAQGHTHPQYVGITPAGVSDVEVRCDFTPGQPLETGNPLDCTILDDPTGTAVSFFRVVPQSGPLAGRLLYSRDGQLKVDAEGYLTNNQGCRIQGRGGDIRLSSTSQVNIDTNGNVAVDNELTGQISVARFEQPQDEVHKLGDNLWRLDDQQSADPGDNALDGSVRLLPQTYERTNASAIDSLVELIQNLRHYEAAQKVIQSEDTALSLAASQIGRQPQQ
jgi:flagellar basal-body rod protein FlgG